MITQTIGDKVYRFKHRTGLVFIASLIGGFIAKEQGAIDWSTWGIIGRSALASVIWFIFALVVFMILGIFRVKKYVKEQEELEKARDYTNSEVAKAIWNARKAAEDAGEKENVTDKIENATDAFKKEVVQGWNDAKSIPTAELLSQIKDEVYLISYTVYGENGKEIKTFAMRYDKNTQTNRFSVCRDEQMATAVWMIAQEEMDNAGISHSNASYRKVAMNKLLEMLELFQKDTGIDGIYFFNNALDHRSVSLEELKSIIN
jgi:uncharacterized membrane protein